MPTARDDYQLACAWDLLDEIYGSAQEDEPIKEKRVDRHGFVKQGRLEDFPTLNRIANAVFQASAFIEIDGKRVYTRPMANNTITGLDHKGVRYVEQNPASGSTYGAKARNGEKIIWIMRNPGGYIGRIENGVVWKDPQHVKVASSQPVSGRTTVIHIRDAPANWKTDPRYVYIGRRNFAENLPASKWANPIPLRTQETQEREDNIRQFSENFEISALRPQAGELKGKVLVCYCKSRSQPKACHGDVLAGVANYG